MSFILTVLVPLFRPLVFRVVFFIYSNLSAILRSSVLLIWSKHVKGKKIQDDKD